jgi:hypothetical protein
VCSSVYVDAGALPEDADESRARYARNGPTACRSALAHFFVKVSRASERAVAEKAPRLHDRITPTWTLRLEETMAE